ncbi:hypothetical protein DLAC_00272 [Tieghemostelium lacteum]|uniref:Response regulatory domain-containing protein n=1 Tax=Tieghemostelium lacteum TaxID=361077 RepID=A0A152A9R7_TIELA|nr:hypothetical protein DLAC_00272 [Tieghemostelium lacteum]|eukprot:KYR02807.1 hypothetical protein DLAC_00272 [Tieghemostelium lacteum]
MFSLKDYCIDFIIQYIKSGKLFKTEQTKEKNDEVDHIQQEQTIDLTLLSSELLEYLFNILKKINKFKLNNDILEVLHRSSIQSLNLSNEDEINVKQWSKYLISQNTNNTSNTSNNSRSNNINSSTCIISLNLANLQGLKEKYLESILEYHKRLKHVNLSYCTNITGNSIYISKHLVSLNLRGCLNFKSENLKIISNNLKRLQILILSKISNINDIDLESLKQLESLTTLKLNNCHNITSLGLEFISEISKLKNLYLNYCTLLSQENALTHLSSKSLELLEISFCFIEDKSLGIIVEEPIEDLQQQQQEQDTQQQQQKTPILKISKDNSFFKLQSLRSLSIRHNRLTPNFLRLLIQEENREFLSQLKKLDLRESIFIKVESALCLYPTKLDSGFELYISSVLNRRSTNTCTNSNNNNSNGNISNNIFKDDRIILEDLYKSFNNITITSKNQLQLNRSSLYLSILEKQEHFPLILLGEDESFQARIVKNVLERRNFDVRIAENGKTAFEMFCETPFFVLVIMDIYMPIINGLNSIRMIRQYEKNTNRKRTPIIICSGNDSIVSHSDSNQVGDSNNNNQQAYDAFISKPLKPNVFDLILKLTSSNNITSSNNNKL